MIAKAYRSYGSFEWFCQACADHERVPGNRRSLRITSWSYENWEDAVKGAKDHNDIYHPVD